VQALEEQKRKKKKKTNVAENGIVGNARLGGLPERRHVISPLAVNIAFTKQVPKYTPDRAAVNIDRGVRLYKSGEPLDLCTLPPVAYLARVGMRYSPHSAAFGAELGAVQRMGKGAEQGCRAGVEGSCRIDRNDNRACRSGLVSLTRAPTGKARIVRPSAENFLNSESLPRLRFPPHPEPGSLR